MSLKCVVLETFKNSTLKNYRLRPSHYLSALVSQWDTVHNVTKVEIKLISDADMYLFFEQGMRGEVSYVSRRYR